ncbi:MAG: glycerophosphoryl diester phosphodiesterase membrane domain-containing protein [Chloroflexi bacterium]|nr:glycerophosphoryl diester phosphodiesterase membrane domain-containing protein [Chloroflexota bacterium]
MSAPGFRLRPLGVADILDESFRIFRRHFLALIAIGTVCLVPVAALQIVLQLLVVLTSSPGGIILVTVITTIASLISYLVLFAAMVHAISEICLGRPPAVGASLAIAPGRFLPMLGVSLLTFLAVGLMIITIIGLPFALYFSIAWGFTLPLVVLERIGVLRSFSRSRSLVRGNWWRVLGVTLLYMLLSFVVGIVAGIPGAILTVVIAVLRLPESFQILSGSLNVLASTAAGILVSPFSYAGWVLMYYDLRSRKEGFDLELLAAEVAAPQPDPRPIDS